VSTPLPPLRNWFLGWLWILAGLAAFVGGVAGITAIRAQHAIERGYSVEGGPGANDLVPAVATVVVFAVAMCVFLAAALVLHGMRWYERHPVER
jgi:uncharacterized membrane protein